MDSALPKGLISPKSVLPFHEFMNSSKRIIYWDISCLEPEIEAISKEVFQLAGFFNNSVIFSINRNHLVKFSLRKRCIGFHPAFDPLLRLLIPQIEKHADINHIYGELCPWTFYKTLRQKPTILTIASEKGELRQDFLERCQKIIVQTQRIQKKILASGIDESRVEILYPSVDLSRFKPTERRTDIKSAPRVLFASAPRSAQELKTRGVYLLLESAKLNQKIHYLFLFRRWKSGYTSLKPTENYIETLALNNITLKNDIVSNMPDVYNANHFTVIPYIHADGGKECPNSAIESLCCGIPVLISSVCPFSSFVEEHMCGVVFDPTPSALVDAVESGMEQYQTLAKNAFTIAQRSFSQVQYFSRLGKIYQELT
jgi:glycosyltransferase involved in cell wall biosynthesis